jgi:hypothetical protein
MRYKVEQMKIDMGLKTGPFQPAKGHAAYATTGAVLKNQLRFLMRLLLNATQLVGSFEGIPAHETKQQFSDRGIDK